MGELQVIPSNPFYSRRPPIQQQAFIHPTTEDIRKRLKQRLEALILGNLDRIEESGQFSVYIDQKAGLYQCNITLG